MACFYDELARFSGADVSLLAAKGSLLATNVRLRAAVGVLLATDMRLLAAKGTLQAACNYLNNLEQIPIMLLPQQPAPCCHLLAPEEIACLKPGIHRKF